MKHITAWVLFLLSICCCAFAQENKTIYQVVKQDIPSTVQPGQRVVGHLTLKLIQKGSSFKKYPGATLESGSVSMQVPGDNMVPWYVNEEAKPGDLHEQAILLDVPLDFPEGPASLKVSATGDKADGSVEFQDQNGKVTGDSYIWNLTVHQTVSSEDAVLPPRIPKISSIQLDGRVQESEWANAGFIENLKNDATGKSAVPATRLYLAHTDTDLLIGAVCQEPKMDSVVAIKTEHKDGRVFENECVELFLNPQADRTGYMHFIADILGQQLDALGQDPVGFNPDWKSVSYKGKDFWSCEIQIPFASLAVKAPKSGDAWLANFGRERYAGGKPELYAWNPTFSSFDSTSKFGVLIFDSRKDYLLRRADSLTEESGKWTDSLKQTAQDWINRLADYRKTIASCDEEQATDQYAELEARISNLEKEASKYKLEALRGSLNNSSFFVTRSWPYEKFNGDNSTLDQTLAPIDVTLLQEEWADLAFNITNITDKPVTFRCMLQRKKDTVETLSFPGLATKWQEAIPVASADGNVTWDVIMPIAAGVVTIQPGKTSQVWLSLQIPAKDKQALREGFLEFEPIDGSAGDPVITPIKIQMIPTVLTKNPPIHSFTWNFIGISGKDTDEWMLKHSLDLKSHGVDVYMMHGYNLMPRPKASPDGTLEPMDFSKMDATLKATRDLFPLYYVTADIITGDEMIDHIFGLPFDSPGFEKAYKNWVKAIVARLKKFGIGYDRFVFNPADENTGKKCLDLTRWAKEADPKIRTILDSIDTPDKMPAFDKYCDIWMPHYNHYQNDAYKDSIKYLRSIGKPLCVYYYSEGPNEKHQHPTQRYLYRLWWAYAHDLKGVGYWAQQYYGDPWYRKPSAGAYDTSLVYPSENEIIPSRRWQAWREGWQDTCLFEIAKEKLTKQGNNAALNQMQKLIGDFLERPADPTLAEKARDFAKQAIK